MNFDWLNLDNFINSRTAITYMVAAEGGLISSIFVLYLRKYKGKLSTTSLHELLFLLLVIPIELVGWTPFVVLLALFVDHTPLLSLLIGLAHEPIWLALEKSFDRIALIVVKLLIGKTADLAQDETVKTVPGEKKVEPGLPSAPDSLKEAESRHV